MLAAETGAQTVPAVFGSFLELIPGDPHACRYLVFFACPKFNRWLLLVLKGLSNELCKRWKANNNHR